MRVLLMNLHTCNRGDEAAGLALLRALKHKSGIKELSIFYNTPTKNEDDFIQVEFPVSHHEVKPISFKDKVLMLLGFFLPYPLVFWLLKCSEVLYSELNLIISHDRIISAPSGVNLGIYKDWRYLWRIMMSIKAGKRVAIYSISLGPLQPYTLFGYLAKKALKNVEFLSIRDAKSQRYASEYGISFHASIDTAFLPNRPISNCDSIVPSESSYVVVVPNALYTWNRLYMGMESVSIDNLYVLVLKTVLDMGYEVVLLPQMFGSHNDSEYFQRLKSMCSACIDKITIVDDKHSSDIQQDIMKNAAFLIGARYHTVVFAINNGRPFISLSYEHKMTNTLELLELEKNELAISDGLKLSDDDFQNSIKEKFREAVGASKKIENSGMYASRLASETFNTFSEKYLGKNEQH